MHQVTTLSDEQASRRPDEPTVDPGREMLDPSVHALSADDPLLRAHLLDALPQFSQWLHEVQSHPNLQRMHLELLGNAPPDSTRAGDRPDEDTEIMDADMDQGRALLDEVLSGHEDETTIPRRTSNSMRVLPTTPEIASDPPARNSTATSPGTSNVDQTGRRVHPSSPSSATSDDETPSGEDISTVDEFRTFFRRCHHSLPFLALFVIYFAYQHTTGILVFVIGTVAIMGLDQRVRTQIALKERANSIHLAGIMAMCVIDMIAICSIDGDPNPWSHFRRQVHASPARTGGVVVLDVLWIVIVNDFIIRLSSLFMKAFVAAVKTDKIFFFCCRTRGSTSAGQPITRSDDFARSENRRPSTRALVAFNRRKRKLYGIIEMVSIFIRTIVAGVPWCSYYKLCTSKTMGDIFTFMYIFMKGILLGSQGQNIFKLIRSFVSLGLEYATYVTREDLVEAGSPDCSICYEPMHTPVQLSCSHMFCEECVMEWFDRERSCPLCRANVIPSARGDEDMKPQFFDGSTSLYPQLL